mmetsp:Transcript_789/g.2518  ORF Transcript_789/g.2518 Transcript_789/m.2518 type:complete len:332 (-) Transcript_789:96-1091(-)
MCSSRLPIGSPVRCSIASPIFETPSRICPVRASTWPSTRSIRPPMPPQPELQLLMMPPPPRPKSALRKPAVWLSTPLTTRSVSPSTYATSSPTELKGFPSKMFLTRSPVACRMPTTRPGSEPSTVWRAPKTAPASAKILPKRPARPPCGQPHPSGQMPAIACLILPSSSVAPPNKASKRAVRLFLMQPRNSGTRFLMASMILSHFLGHLPSSMRHLTATMTVLRVVPTAQAMRLKKASSAFQRPPQLTSEVTSFLTLSSDDSPEKTFLRMLSTRPPSESPSMSVTASVIFFVPSPTLPSRSRIGTFPARSTSPSFTRAPSSLTPRDFFWLR